MQTPLASTYTHRGSQIFFLIHLGNEIWTSKANTVYRIHLFIRFIRHAVMKHDPLTVGLKDKRVNSIILWIYKMTLCVFMNLSPLDMFLHKI